MMKSRLWINFSKWGKRLLLMVLIVSVITSGFTPSHFVQAADTEFDFDVSSLDSVTVAHYPLNSFYQYKNRLNENQQLSGSDVSWKTDYVTLVNPGNANNGHIAGNNPGSPVTGRKISFSLNIKLNKTQTRSTSAVNTLLSYGADNNNNLTLRPYYSNGMAAVVLKRNGTDSIVASFPAPAPDMWHNYTISLDGTASTGKLIVWVDGVKTAEVASNGIGADELGNGQFRLNRTIATFSNLDSHYRDVRVFKDALDQDAATYFAKEIRSFTWNDLLALKPLTDGMVVREDLSLFHDPNISWTSSDNSVIDPSTGLVNRPTEGSSAKQVILTMKWFDLSQEYTVSVPSLKSELQAKYAEKKDTIRGDYTNGTWKTITRALDHAKAILADESATQWDIDRAALQIDEAFKWAQTVQPENVVNYSTAGVPVGETWYDTEGNPIQAHGGGFLQQTAEDGKPIYYWVGENKIHNSAVFHAVSLYSSRDLVNWNYEGNILDQFSQTVEGAEYGLLNNKWERPKLLYNEKTKKYVLWGHWETAGSYASSQIAVATADHVAGPYTFLGHWRPGGTLRNWRSDNGIYTDSEYYKSSGTRTAVPASVQSDVTQMGYISRDFTVFADDDGTAYLVSSEGHSMRIHRLNDEYTDVDFTTYTFSDPAAKAADFESYNFYEDVGREAPAVVSTGDGYYLITSGQSGWLPNQSAISYNADITDPHGWTPIKDENGKILPNFTFGNNSTYYSQSTNIMKLTKPDGSNSYVYMGDRWRPSQLSDSRYVWLPIAFNEAEHNASATFTTGWKLNAETGDVQFPKVELISEGKPATITNNDSVTGIEKANDGITYNLNTWGDTSHFFGGLVAPYEYTIDLGEVYDLARIDVAYRLYNGSEMYHRYQIFGSSDNKNWTELVNNNTNMWAGFTSDKLNGNYRYVKLKVNEVRRVNNNALSNGWGSGLVEVQVYSNVDNTPPETTAEMNPAKPDGENGWYKNPVTVTLSATDTKPGVESTFYSLDGGTTWETYTAPFVVSQDGKNNVKYYSVDKAGNTEQVLTLDPINLDQTRPEINIEGLADESYLDDETVTVNYTVSDTISGVNNSSVVALLDGQPIVNGTVIPLYKLSLGQHVLTVSAVDQAGNPASVTKSFMTSTSISSLIELVNLFQTNGSITNDGIANSLLKKLEDNELQSFMNEVKAQSSKHISNEAASYLLRDAEYLLK
ncbi:hypothetical protein QFZ28_005058 [Neobacillus niacini]|nr:hypothetical protein [Neobacillus niacini]